MNQRTFALALLGLLTTPSLAESNWQLNGVKGTIGFEARAEFSSNDGELWKDGDQDETDYGSNLIAVRAAHFRLDTTLSEKVSFHTRFALGTGANIGKVIPHYGYFDWWITEMFGISGGLKKTQQGSYETMDFNFKTPVLSPYAAAMRPFHMWSETMEVMANLGGGGRITLQLVNDLLPTDEPALTGRHTAQFNKRARQPAMILVYQGAYGPISPLVQAGSYDINHSKFYTLGLKAKLAKVTSTLDFLNDQRARKSATDNTKEVTDTLSLVHITIEYEMTGIVRPFVKFAQYENEQGETNLDGNAPFPYSSWDTGSPRQFPNADDFYYGGGLFHDNGQVWAVGAFCLTEGPYYEPYVSVIGRSGMFIKKADLGAAEPATEKKAEMQINLGVAGQF